MRSLAVRRWSLAANCGGIVRISRFAVFGAELQGSPRQAQGRLFSGKNALQDDRVFLYA
jgi:hypothetical protein